MRRRQLVGSALLLAVPLLASSAYGASSSPALHVVSSYCARPVGSGPIPRAQSTHRVVRGCRFDTGAVATDPGVAVTRQGIVFVALSKGGLMRSTDHGRQWTYVSVPALANGDTGAIHGFVTVDRRTNRVYYVTSTKVKSCGGSAGSVISWSENLGKTWHGVTVSCLTYDWGKLVTGKAPPGNRYPSALYFLGVGHREIGGQRFVFRSLNGGKTWHRMKNIASAVTEGGAGVSAPDGTIYYDYPEVPLDPTGLVNPTYPFKPGTLCHAMVAVSQNYGKTWRQEAVPGSLACTEISGDQRVAVDRAGTVYAIWTDDIENKIHMSYSRNKGRTWSKPVIVMPPGTRHSNGLAGIVAGAPGHVVISSQDTSSIVNPRVGIVPGLGNWDSYLTVTSNATANSPRLTSVDLDPPGDPTYVTGQAPTEAEGYVALSPSGKAWTVFTRHTPFGGGQTPGEVWAATLDTRKASA